MSDIEILTEKLFSLKFSCGTLVFISRNPKVPRNTVWETLIYINISTNGYEIYII